MNREEIQADWKQLKGIVRQKWGKLTDADLNIINGNREELVARIQQRYEIAWEAAEGQVDNFSW